MKYKVHAKRFVPFPNPFARLAWELRFFSSQTASLGLRSPSLSSCFLSSSRHSHLQTSPTTSSPLIPAYPFYTSSIEAYNTMPRPKRIIHLKPGTDFKDNFNVRQQVNQEGGVYVVVYLILVRFFKA
jgi:hypothetical protein